MKWLVTYNTDTGLKKVLDQLEQMGCEVLNADNPIPVGTNEEVLNVEGPANLAQLAAPHRQSMKVYRNSTQSTI